MKKSPKIVYKLTSRLNYTFVDTAWGPGVSHSGTGKGKLCGPGWIHYYSHPLLAVLLNPIHADFESPKLWEAKAEGKILSDRGLKFGCEKLTTIREIPLPEISTTQRVAFGILCALQVCSEPNFMTWANRWISNEDRSGRSARAWSALSYSPYGPVWVAAESAREAAAAWSAREAWSAQEAAKAAAEAAAWAARAAARAVPNSDKILADFSEDVAEILIRMEVPGAKWLPLLEA